MPPEKKPQPANAALVPFFHIFFFSLCSPVGSFASPFGSFLCVYFRSSRVQQQHSSSLQINAYHRQLVVTLKLAKQPTIRINMKDVQHLNVVDCNSMCCSASRFMHLLNWVPNVDLKITEITIWNSIIGLIEVFVLKVHHFTNCLFSLLLPTTLLCVDPGNETHFHPMTLSNMRKFFSLFNHINYHICTRCECELGS